MCATPVPPQHPHLVQVAERRMLCACGPCGFLFDNPGAGGGGYRRVPDRYLSDPDFRLTDAQWDELQIPVGMAFFLHNSAQERVIACYPSPAGATESELELEAWTAGVGGEPAGRRAGTRRRGAAGPPGQPGAQRVPARPDRRLLPARRAGAAALARLRRRPRGVARDRRLLRRAARAGRPGAGRPGRPTRDRSLTCCGSPAPAPGPSPTRPARRCSSTCSVTDGQRAGGCTRSPCASRSGSSRAAARTPPRSRRSWSTCSASPSRWGETLNPLQLATVGTTVPGFTGRDHGAADRAADLRPRHRGDEVLPRPRRAARSRCCCCSPAPLFYAGPDGVQVGLVSWHEEARFRLPVATWRAAMDEHFPDSAWRAGQHPHPRRARRRTAPSGSSPPGTTRSSGC